MQVLDRWLTRINVAVAIIAGFTLVGLMGLTVLNVARRGLGLGVLPYVFDLTEVLLVVAVFLGLCVTERSGANVSTPIVTSRLPRKIALVVRSLSAAACVAFLIAMIWKTSVRAIAATLENESTFGLVQFPVWPARIVVPVGLTLFLVEFIRRTIVELRKPGFPEADASAPAFAPKAAS